MKDLGAKFMMASLSVDSDQTWITDALNRETAVRTVRPQRGRIHSGYIELQRKPPGLPIQE
jgi:hypothetical protein